mmetsp:Transcript_496/g.1678  ORF Transcript_496/g.1678 Transcript_496/m.1678 type:complete len:127 (-) Transcript_496:417-797(-)
MVGTRITDGGPAGEKAAEGVAVGQIGPEVFRICDALVDEVMLVDEREIAAAVRDVFLDTRAVLEPAGAVSVAGLKQYVARRPPAPSAPPPAFVAIAGDASNIEFSNIWSVNSLLERVAQAERTPAE